MATINFNLRPAAKGSAQRISLIFRHQGEKLVYSTGLKVPAKYWNESRQRVKNVTHVPDRDRINSVLDQFHAEVRGWTVRQMENREPMTGGGLRDHLDNFTGRRPGPAKDLFSFFANWIKAAPTRILPRSGKPPTKATIQTHRATLATLTDFARAYPRKVDFPAIDQRFYDDFILWLHRQDTALNTVGKHIKILKTVLNAATEAGVNTNLAFRARSFRVPKEDVFAIYLDREELATVAALDLTDRPRLDRVRDLFLLGAWTGLRFSDFTRLTPDHIDGDNIRITQTKTGGVVVIPLHDTIPAIFAKYGGAPPPAISNVKANRYLKEIGQLAGLTGRLSYGKTKGGGRVSVNAKKWELLTTHTARRSFATNMYKSGAPALSLMQITGHKSETAFMKYIRVTKQEHADIIRRHLKGAPAKGKLKAV